MDSNPRPESQNEPSGADKEASSTPQTTDATPRLTTGFSYVYINIGAAILRSMTVGNNLSIEVKRIVHVPKARDHLNLGFNALAETMGVAFAALADCQNYDRNAFYDACDKFLDEIRERAEYMKLAQLAGMSLEDFEKQMAEAKVTTETKETT